MKKLLFSFICGLFLTVGASHANAIYLADWDYHFDMSISAIPSEFVSEQSDGSIAWISGNNLSTLSIQPTSALDTFENVLAPISMITSERESYTMPTSLFLGQTVTESDIANTSTSPMRLADLTVNFGGTVPNGYRFNLTYKIPLWSYYDAYNDASYVYFSLYDVTSTGSSSMVYEGEIVGISSFDLLFNDSTLNTYTGALSQDIFSGWKFSTTEETPPAPTPEPATMLLTGLGLAGLGYMKRRRNIA